MSADKKWTADDVSKVIANPIYVGMGSFPQIIDDETWLTTATKQIKKEGPHKFLTRMLRVLRETLSTKETT